MNINRRSIINAFETSQEDVYVKNHGMHCCQPGSGSASLTIP